MTTDETPAVERGPSAEAAGVENSAPLAATPDSPFWSPVTRWEKAWKKPTEISGTPMVTLGPRPGNMSKPAPNHFELYTWVKNSSLPPISLYDEPLPVEETEVVEEETVPAAPVPEPTTTTMTSADMEVDVPAIEDTSNGVSDQSGSVQTVDSSVSDLNA